MPKAAPKKASVADVLKKLPPPKKKLPLWEGPESSGPQGGITQSLLSSFLVCRERFRIKTIEGLGPEETFNKSMEYGNMWHVCEESLAAAEHGTKCDWHDKLEEYCMKLAGIHKTQGAEVLKWYEICRRQFLIYIEYWKKNKDVTNRTPLLQEEVFCVPITLPSGRTAYLRGKFDSVDLIKDGKTSGIWLQENKSKGDINAELMKRMLMFDIQTGIYLVALSYNVKEDRLPDVPVRGVRYNVIRRPLAGGKHSIKQLQATKTKPEETLEEYYNRLAGLIQEEADLALVEKRDCHYFMRWKVEWTPTDLENFKNQFLFPILESLCDWYEWVTMRDFEPFGTRAGIINRTHFRMPYGVYSPLLDGGLTEVDQYLDYGSDTGLVRKQTLFPELP